MLINKLFESTPLNIRIPSILGGVLEMVKKIFQTISFVLGQVGPGWDETVIGKLRAVKGVEDPYLIYGKYDFFAQVRVDDLPGLKSVLASISNIENIQQITTLIGEKTGGETMRPLSCQHTKTPLRGFSHSGRS